ncbi:MAG: RNA polymerase sigma factor [Actinomycetota bacterium]
MLRRRGVPQWLVDDIVQETGIKLWRMWDEVDAQGRVTGLSRTVAVNLLRDHWRRASRREVPGEVPDRVADSDVERQGLARVELRSVTRALRKLQPSYRNVLLAEAGVRDPVSGLRPGALRMLRLRARRELATLIDRASGFGAVLGHRIANYMEGLAGRWQARFGVHDGEGLARAAVGMAMVIAIGGVLQSSDSGRAFGREGGASLLPADLVSGGGEGIGLSGSGWAHELRDVARTAARSAGELVERTKKRPLTKARVGQLGEVGAQGEVESLGLRIGTNEDGSLFIGCSDGTETGATGVTECDVGEGTTRAMADVHYRLGDKRGRLRFSTDRD